MLRTEGSKSRSCGIKFLEPRRREGPRSAENHPDTAKVRARSIGVVQGYEFYNGAATAAGSFGSSLIVGLVIKNRTACS